MWRERERERETDDKKKIKRLASEKLSKRGEKVEAKLKKIGGKREREREREKG